MIWFKSFLVALLAVVAGAPIMLVLLNLALYIMSGTPIQVDVVALAKASFVRLLLILVFVGGFLWEYFRLQPK
jgi:hypothetical protein